MATGGRPEQYVTLILGLDPERALSPADICRLNRGWIDSEKLGKALNARARKIRSMFPGIGTVDGRGACYPGILWQATLNANTLGREAHAAIQARAAEAALTLMGEPDIEEPDIHR